MISFEEAREIVAAINSKFYRAKDMYRTAPWGYENETYYEVLDGPWIKFYGDPDSDEYWESRSPNDGEINLVNKETGEYVCLQGPGDDGKPQKFVGTPVGDGKPDWWVD